MERESPHLPPTEPMPPERRPETGRPVEHGAFTPEMLEELETVGRRERSVRRGVVDRLQRRVLGRFGKDIAMGAMAGGALIGGTAHLREDAGATAFTSSADVVPAEANAGVTDAGAAGGTEDLEDVEAESPLEVDFTGLDAEATPERMRRLLTQTFPRGWVNVDVASVRFADEDGPLVVNVTPAMNALAIAAEVNVPAGATDITFFKGARGMNRMAVYSETMSHELAHANDWRRDGAMEEADRQWLQEAVVSRLAAPDRFKSAYVESIDAAEADQRQVEYWAEISEAYFSLHSLSPTLPDEDAAIVSEVIRRQDPAFDRDAALRKRTEIIREMRWSGVRPALVGRLLKEAGEEETVAAEVAWVESRIMAGEPDEAQQRRARAEAVVLARDWATDADRREFVRLMGRFFKVRESLLATLAQEDDAKQYEGVIGAYGDMMRQRAAMQSPETDAFAERLLAFVEQTDLVVGSDRRGGVLSEDEYEDIKASVANGPAAPSNRWLIDAFGWRTPDDIWVQISEQ